MLRGYFLLVIIIDHLERWPGFFELITGEGKLWVSAAEGFFIISGLMVGLIRGRKAMDKPLHQVARSLLKRAGLLYVWGVGISFAFLALALALNSYGYVPAGYQNALGDLPGTIFNTLTLQYSYGWTGFLKFYCVFLAISPLTIWLLRRGFWWPILAVSIAIWTQGWDNWYLSWQLLFFSGTVVGYYAPEIVNWWRKLASVTRWSLASSILLLATATVLVSTFFTFGWEITKQPGAVMPFDTFASIKAQLDPYFHKTSLPLPRMLLGALWFTALLLLFVKLEPILKRLLGWLLIPFGRASLYVYITHGFLVFALDILIPDKTLLWLNVVAVSATIFIVWLLVKRRFLFSVIPR